MAHPIAWRNSATSKTSLLFPQYSPVTLGLTGPVQQDYAGGYNSLEWRNSIEPGPGSYFVIYSDTQSQEGASPGYPVGWVTATQDATGLLNLINVLPARSHQTPFATFADAMDWLISENKYFPVNKDYPAIAFTGSEMLLAYDPTFLGSYPEFSKENGFLYDISGNDSTPAGLTSGARIDGLSSIELETANNEYVDVPPGVVGRMTAGVSRQCTVSLWFYYNGSESPYTLFDLAQGEASATPHFMRVETTGNTLAAVYNFDGLAQHAEIYTADITLTAGTWYHLCITISVDDTNGNVDGNIYINGSPESAVKAYSLASPYRFNLAGAEYSSKLGCAQSSGVPVSPYLDGRLGSFYVYSKALDATEVLDLYNRTNFY